MLGAAALAERAARPRRREPWAPHLPRSGAACANSGNLRRPRPGRIHRPGGGRRRTVDLEPTLRTDLEALIEPTSRGHPISPLRWTSKSRRRLAAELGREGHQVSYRIVAGLLHPSPVDEHERRSSSMPADREESPVHEPGDDSRTSDEPEEVAKPPEDDELERAHRAERVGRAEGDEPA